jgi:hypothetical protein
LANVEPWDGGTGTISKSEYSFVNAIFTTYIPQPSDSKAMIGQLSIVRVCTARPTIAPTRPKMNAAPAPFSLKDFGFDSHLPNPISY